MTSKNPACGICKSKYISKPSTAWCFKCNEGLCEVCKEHHTLNKASKSHGIIPVTEFQKLPVSVLQIVESCKSHGERYQAYCHEHECSCCTDCLIEDHRNCKDITDIDEVVCSIKSSNKTLEIEDALHELSKYLKMVQKNRRGNLSSFTLYRQDIEKEIQKARHTINAHLGHLERELLKELTKIENDERKKISKLLSSVDLKETEIDGLQTSLSIMKKHASDLQTFLLTKKIEKELVDTDSLIHFIQDHDDVIISVQTDNIVKGVNRNISKIGEIVVQTTPVGMLLVRLKSTQAGAYAAVVARCRPVNQYETAEREKDPCFIVTVKPGEDALKFGLNGQYRLRLIPTGFILEDIETMISKCYWSYNVVEHYGKSDTGKEFEITVKRQNLLGVGTILFSFSSKDDLDEIVGILPDDDEDWTF